MKYVIIGNGIAGIHAAEAIRQFDPRGDITMIGDETSGPYCRPMIGLLLDGSIQSNKLLIRKESFYRDLKINSVSGKRVTGIDVKNKKVFIKYDETRSDLHASHSLMGLICKLMSIIDGHAPVPETRGINRSEFAYDKLLIATGADPRPIKAGGLHLKKYFFTCAQMPMSGRC